MIANAIPRAPHFGRLVVCHPFIIDHSVATMLSERVAQE
jgi:hypothetical protein